MKMLSDSKAKSIGQELIDLISSIILNFEGMNNDLQDKFGNDILTKKIGEGFRDGKYKYSLRDRYGSICDEVLNTSLSIADKLGIEGSEFRKAIDEAIGDSPVYDGEYDSYSAPYPSDELLELNKGLKRWWKPK